MTKKVPFVKIDSFPFAETHCAMPDGCPVCQSVGLGGGWIDYEIGRRSPNAAAGECGIRFGYNNGSANAMDGHPNVFDRCRLVEGHTGVHDAGASQDKEGG